MGRAYRWEPTYYYDGGHGWLAVPRAELVRLGLVGQVTAYSYELGETVFLEEDGDMRLWIDAVRADGGGQPDPPEIHDGEYSPIRGYADFHPREEEL